MVIYRKTFGETPAPEWGLIMPSHAPPVKGERDGTSGKGGKERKVAEGGGVL